MSFANAEFLPFLLLAVCLFTFVPRRGRTLFLLLASYAFYLQHHPLHGLLLLGSTLLDYSVGRALGRITAPGRRKALLGLSLFGNLGALAFFKYGGFVVENVNRLLERGGVEAVDWPELILPLGISFYTFQTIAYTIDVYRGRIEPCRSLATFALYVSFFPQLVAGPIERAGHLIPQLQEARVISLPNLESGGRLILWGLLKKLVLADQLLRHTRLVFLDPGANGTISLLLAAIAMNVVLYLDFSAYTDIARGSARLFGIRLVDNFRRPFLSRSMNEFASRWHISLFTWIADYIYSPLARGRPTHWRLWRNNVATMGLFGLWHGASWTFIIWGVAGGAAISLQHSIRLFRARRGHRAPPERGWCLLDVVPWLATIIFTSTFIVFFFSPDLVFAREYFRNLLSFSGGLGGTWALWTTLALAVGLLVHASGALLDLLALWRRIGWPGRTVLWLAVIAALLWLRTPRPEEFIYFRF